MKYLKYLFGIIVLLVLLFLANGIFSPSIYYESEVVVNKPVKEAWAVMSDESKLPKWIEGFKKTELVSGTANTIGAVSNVYIDDRGQETVMKETITNVKPNEIMAMRFSMDFMDMDYEMSMSEKDGQTTIKSKSTTFGNGIFAKSMVAFMKNPMKSQEDKNLNSLKKLIEENTTVY